MRERRGDGEKLGERFRDFGFQISDFGLAGSRKSRQKEQALSAGREIERTSERFDYCRICDLSAKAPELPVLIIVSIVSSGTSSHS